MKTSKLSTNKDPKPCWPWSSRCGCASRSHRSRSRNSRPRCKPWQTAWRPRAVTAASPPRVRVLSNRRVRCASPRSESPGGQPGHPGATRQQVAEPAQWVQHAPTQCAACGTALSEVAGRLGTERRQVFALPPLPLVVTAHRVVIKACPGCGQDPVGTFPAEVPCGASYGARVKRLLTSLTQEPMVLVSYKPIKYNSTCWPYCNGHALPPSW